MSGGILVADMLEGGTRFALGVSMILRRGAFQKAGGYEDLGQYYAEDFVLGNRLAERGFGVRMANYVVRLMVLPQGLRGSFRDQLRWMKSTRRSRPAGHLGTGLTYAVPFGVLGLAWGLLAGHPAIGLLWLLATCVNRWVMAAVVLDALEDEEAAKPTLTTRCAIGWDRGMDCELHGSRMQYHGGAYCWAWGDGSSRWSGSQSQAAREPAGCAGARQVRPSFVRKLRRAWYRAGQQPTPRPFRERGDAGEDFAFEESRDARPTVEMWVFCRRRRPDGPRQTSPAADDAGGAGWRRRQWRWRWCRGRRAPVRRRPWGRSTGWCGPRRLRRRKVDGGGADVERHQVTGKGPGTEKTWVLAVASNLSASTWSTGSSSLTPFAFALASAAVATSI